MKQTGKPSASLLSAALIAAAFLADSSGAQEASPRNGAPAATEAPPTAARSPEPRGHRARVEARARAQNPFLGPRPTLAPLLREVSAGVVSISVAGLAIGSGLEDDDLGEDPELAPYFGEPDMLPEESIGSGVVVDARKGLIVTNAHVISGASDIIVTLTDRRRFQAELVGSDEATDIAVLRVDANRLSAIPYGDSTTLEVGDFVVAVGNPFGLGQAATLGIVSALGRGLDVEGYEDFIQTDASINPGNSGGALLDLDGRLVGMNTAIVSPAGGNVGIGFAIPAEMLEIVVRQLIEHGEVRRGRLGVLVQDVTPGLADALGLGTSTGALITDVEPGSSAAMADIDVGDVVTQVNGRVIDTATGLRNSIGLVRIGETVSLTLLRDGRTISKNVRISEPPPAARAPGEAIESLAGAKFLNLDGSASGLEGVLVVAVMPGSLAERSGLMEGDLVTAVNRRSVSSVEELGAAADQAGQTFALRVQREGRPLYILVDRSTH